MKRIASRPHQQHNAGMSRPPRFVGRCWSCQTDLVDAVVLRETPLLFVPCCQSCWEQIPPAQRLVIAEKFHEKGAEADHRATMVQALQAAGQSVEALLRGMIQMGHDEDEGDAWKRQSLN